MPTADNVVTPPPQTSGGPALPQVRKLITAIPGPESLKLHARRTDTVAASVSSTLPVYAAAAGGGVLVDVDGNSLIDFASGIGVVGVGNSAPRVVEGAAAQLGSFTHTAFTVNPYAAYVEVCEYLARITPGDHAKRSALLNSGAEAIENAVKIARSVTGRDAIVVLENAFHGRTNLTMAMTAKSAPFKSGFGPFAPEIYRVPGSYPFRDGLTGPDAAARSIAMIESLVGGSAVAAIVIEPVAGEGGFIVPAPGYLPALAEYARDAGILLVFDEIQSGIGRTGKWFACEHEGVVPDLITTAKGIGGGLPLSAVTGRAELMDAVHAGGIGGTYGGNPVACAAALGALTSIEQDGLLERAQWIETVIREVLEPLVTAHPEVGELRGRGAMMGIELVESGSSAPDPALAGRVAARCHEAGVIVLVTGTHSNFIRLLPPLVIPEELLRDGLGVLATAVKAECA